MSRKQDIEKVVDAHLGHLGAFDSPPAEDVARSRHRALDRLRTNAATVSRPRVSHPSRGGWTWRTAGIAVAAAVIVVAAAGTAIMWRQADDALFRVAEGRVHHDRGTIQSNGDGAGAVLMLTDGSRVEMRSQSELALERAGDGLRIQLIRGGIIVEAATQRTGHLYVQTKDVTVSVVGTVFLVNADEQGSRVAVIDGEVHVQQGATGQTLLPGEQVATSPSMAPASIQEEIAWARNAPLLVGLLQQAVATPPALRQGARGPGERFDNISIRPAIVAPGEAGRGAGGGGGGRRRNLRGDDPCSAGGEPVVDPSRFDAANVTLIQLASWAYGIDCWMRRGPDVLFGGPDWIRRDGYDVIATIPETTPSYTTQQLRRHEAPALQGMLRAMLEDRFGIVVRRERREMPVYVLSVASGGPKFTRANTPARVVDAKGNTIDPQQAATNPGPGFVLPSPDAVHPEFSVWQEGDPRNFLNRTPSEIHGRKRTMADLTDSLWLYMGRPVLDRTGLKGNFNFFFTFVVFECPTCPFVRPPSEAPREPEPPGVQPGPPLREVPIVEVLQRVGLELKPSREQVEVLVIERVNRPSEN
jgi:uncharacterized protein (TIGR03435 family)